MNDRPDADRPYCTLRFGNLTVRALIDSGAAISVISQSCFNKIAPRYVSKLNTKTKRECYSASGDCFQNFGSSEIKIHFDGLKHSQYTQCFQVLSNLRADLILGSDFLLSNKAILDYHQNTLRLGNRTISLAGKRQIALVNTTQRTKIPPHSTVMFPCRVPRSTENGIYMLTFLDTTVGLQDRAGVSIPNTLVRVTQSKLITVSAVNETNENCEIPRRAAVGVLHRVHSSDIAPVSTSRESPEISEIDIGQKPGDSVVDRLLQSFHHPAEDSVPADLSEEQLGQFRSLLDSKSHLFVSKDTELGSTNIQTCKIETEGPPIKQKPYRVAFSQRAHVEKHVNEMLEAGIIRESSSAWSSPIVIVDKKDTDEKRFCVDFRRVNQVSKQNVYPLPNIDDILSAFNGAKYFSKLDLKSGFWQIEMEEGSKPKTAFITHLGLFEFNRLPFGLQSAPSVFQATMNSALEGLIFKFCFAYLDDVIVYSNSFQEHLSHLASVLDRFDKAGLKLKVSKCEFFRKQLGFLGHLVSDVGITADPKKVEVIKGMSPPTTVRGVRAFIGLCSYYRRYVRDFSKTAAPIIALTKKNAPFEWTDECQQAFDFLKTCLTQAPILRHCDPNKPYYLYCDASDYAVGSILAQKDEDGNEHVIHYLSSQLGRTQRKYSTSEKEAYAIVFSLKKLRQYLLGAKVTIYSDHKPLRGFFKSPFKNNRLERWGLLFSEFDCEIQYRPGHSMKADFVSRMSGETPKEDVDDVGEEEMYVQAVRTGDRSSEQQDVQVEDDALVMQDTVEEVEIESDTAGEEVMKAAVSPDGEVAGLMKRLLEHDIELPDSVENVRTAQAEDPRVKEIIDALKRSDSSFHIDYTFDPDDVVYRLASPCKYDKEYRLQLVVPSSLQEGILQQCHDAIGHVGVDKGHDLLRRRFYWKNSYRDLLDYVKRCTVCNQRKLRAMEAPVQEAYVPHAPMTHVSLDLSGPFPETVNGDRYILTVICMFSRWPECFPIPSKKTEVVARVLCEQFFPRYGYPEVLVSDNGTEFVSEVIEVLSRKMGIARIKTAPYNPRANGINEASHKVINDVIAKHTKPDQSDWPDQLPIALQAMRTTVHSGTRYSPFFLMFGRDPRLNLDLIFTPKLKYHGEDYVPTMVQRLHHAYVDARNNLMENQKRNQCYKNKDLVDQEIVPGDLVYLKVNKINEGLSRKIANHMQPFFRVLEKKSPTRYIIKHGPTGKVVEAHLSQLRKELQDDRWEEAFRESEYVLTPEEEERLRAEVEQRPGKGQQRKRSKPAPTRTQPLRACRLSIPPAISMEAPHENKQDDESSEDEGDYMEAETSEPSTSHRDPQKRDRDPEDDSGSDTDECPVKKFRISEIVMPAFLPEVGQAELVSIPDEVSADVCWDEKPEVEPQSSRFMRFWKKMVRGGQ